MKTLLVVVTLVSVLAYWYPGIVAVPINASSEESTEDNSNESASNESVYLLKEVSYEVGLIDTVDLGNSSQVVIVKPADRIETDDVTLWTAKNESAPENEMATVAAPVETTADEMAETTLSAATAATATTAQVNEPTPSATDRMWTKEESTPENQTMFV